MALGAVWFVLGLAGCSREKEEAQPAPVVTVQVGGVVDRTIERKVNADAIIYPLDQAALVPKIAAPVKKFYVNRGSEVHAGQLLAELEAQDLAGAVTDSQGGYQQAQASYDAAVQKAQQDLEVAKQTYEIQQKLYQNRMELLEQGAVSRKDVEDTALALTQAKTALDTAQKAYDVKVSEGELTSAKGKSASAEADLSYARITSPIDGVVTDRPFYAGETAPSGTPLLTIMNISQVIVRAHVPPADAALMKVGDAATVSSPGQPDSVQGKVTLVSPALDPNSTTVEIWVQAPNPKWQFKPGDSARLAIVTQTVPHAVVAPAAALVISSDTGATQVIVLDTDNNPHKQTVQTGIREADDVQITKGLMPGQRVVTVGAFELANEDDPVLAKTKIQVQSPVVPDEDEDEDQ